MGSFVWTVLPREPPVCSQETDIGSFGFQTCIHSFDLLDIKSEEIILFHLSLVQLHVNISIIDPSLSMKMSILKMQLIPTEKETVIELLRKAHKAFLIL